VLSFSTLVTLVTERGAVVRPGSDTVAALGGRKPLLANSMRTSRATPGHVAAR